MQIFVEGEENFGCKRGHIQIQNRKENIETLDVACQERYLDMINNTFSAKRPIMMLRIFHVFWESLKLLLYENICMLRIR